jgi:hypothetical protein
LGFCYKSCRRLPFKLNPPHIVQRDNSIQYSDYTAPNVTLATRGPHQLLVACFTSDGMGRMAVNDPLLPAVIASHD